MDGQTTLLLDREEDSAIVEKAKKAKQSKAIGASEFAEIREKLRNHIGQYMTIQDADALAAYVKEARHCGIVAIDTETTGLDPILDNIVGVSLYYPGGTACYIPLHHVSYITGLPIKKQVSADAMAAALEELNGCVSIIFHNYVFDKRVIRNQLGVEMKATWDTQKAWRYLNENESSSLKYLYRKYIKADDDEVLSYGNLFSGITFDKVPIDIATLYAAGDPYKTYMIYDLETQIFQRNKTLQDLERIYLDLEMPLQSVLADIEDAGIGFDMEECERLSKEYEEKMLKVGMELSEMMQIDSERIIAYRNTHPNSGLDNPINFKSPQQVGIYLYDICGYSLPESGKHETGRDALKRIDSDFTRKLLELREIEKIYDAFLDVLPKQINSKTHRIHTLFNSYGARTGRMTSQSPNMQQLPSRHSEIRNIFVADEGHSLISCDYSQQEPRILAYCSQDENMIKAYRDGKDLYSWMASLVYGKPYEECLEHYPDGTVNKEGYKLRKSMKSVNLGISYGLSIKGLAEQLGIGIGEAQKIMSDFEAAFPAVASWKTRVISNAKTTGYVTTIWGRKRRVPEMRWKQTPQNRSQIRAAERQVVNSIIQGSAADMTKWAMLKIYRSEELRSMGARLVLQVHDEVILECLGGFAKDAGSVVQKCMLDAAADMIDIPMKCDVSIGRRWGDL